MLNVLWVWHVVMGTQPHYGGRGLPQKDPFGDALERAAVLSGSDPGRYLPRLPHA